jgi:hypothetical protein
MCIAAFVLLFVYNAAGPILVVARGIFHQGE